MTSPATWPPALSCRAVPALVALLLGALGSGIATDASAQATKRLAPAPSPAPAGEPWDSCKDMEGYVVDESAQVTVQSALCDGAIRAWLLKRVEQDSGPSRLQVLDRLTVRTLQAGERFSAGPYCTVNGEEMRWLAIYFWKGRKRITGRSGGIVKAWTANLQTGRLEPAPRALVRQAVCTANPDE